MPVVCNIYKVCLYRVCTMGKKLCLEKLLFEKMKINLFKKSCEIKCLRNVHDNRSATPRGDHHCFNCWQLTIKILLVSESQFSRHTNEGFLSHILIFFFFT